MMTHDHTIFCDDFIAERQIEAYEDSYPEMSLEETMARWSESPLRHAVRFLAWGVASLGARVLLTLARVADAIQWASEPRKRQAPKKVHPGLMLEFVVFGIVVVCGLMSTML